MVCCLCDPVLICKYSSYCSYRKRRTAVKVISSRSFPAMRYEEALRIAEERDRTLRAAFNRFDLDASGTIDMEEILALLDHLNLLDNLPVSYTHLTLPTILLV